MTRGLGRGFAEGWQGRELLEAIERARTVPEAELPSRDRPAEQLRAPSAVVDLLRTLLRLKAEQAGVAGRLVASADELDRLAAGKRDVAGAEGLAPRGVRRRCGGPDRRPPGAVPCRRPRQAHSDIRQPRRLGTPRLACHDRSA